jgi:hypothetical protein
MANEVANTRLKLQVTPSGDPIDSFQKDLFTKFF